MFISNHPYCRASLTTSNGCRVHTCTSTSTSTGGGWGRRGERRGGARREKGRGEEGFFRFAHCEGSVRYGMVGYGIGVGTDAFVGTV